MELWSWADLEIFRIIILFIIQKFIFRIDPCMRRMTNNDQKIKKLQLNEKKAKNLKKVQKGTKN